MPVSMTAITTGSVCTDCRLGNSTTLTYERNSARLSSSAAKYHKESASYLPHVLAVVASATVVSAAATPAGTERTHPANTSATTSANTQIQAKTLTFPVISLSLTACAVYLSSLSNASEKRSLSRHSSLPSNAAISIAPPGVDGCPVTATRMLYIT